jgi:uncharacterized damage-inducible protein DinB
MQYLKELFAYNAKFADEVIKSLENIEPDKFLEQKVSSWGSLRNLVMHLIEAEDYWINKIVQGKPFAQYDFDEYGDLVSIEKRWKEVDADILLFLDTLTPEKLKQTYKVSWDKEYSYPLERILMHLYTHTVHTRGQIVAGIKAVGGKPPYVHII